MPVRAGSLSCAKQVVRIKDLTARLPPGFPCLSNFMNICRNRNHAGKEGGGCNFVELHIVWEFRAIRLKPNFVPS